MTKVNPNSIKGMDQCEKITYIENGKGNWHYSVKLRRNNYDEVLFVEQVNQRLRAFVADYPEYWRYVKKSNWINCRGKYAKV